VMIHDGNITTQRDGIEEIAVIHVAQRTLCVTRIDCCMYVSSAVRRAPVGFMAKLEHGTCRCPHEREPPTIEKSVDMRNAKHLLR
jgi:hypothetical protein